MESCVFFRVPLPIAMNGFRRPEEALAGEREAIACAGIRSDLSQSRHDGRRLCVKLPGDGEQGLRGLRRQEPAVRINDIRHLSMQPMLRRPPELGNTCHGMISVSGLYAACL